MKEREIDRFEITQLNTIGSRIKLLRRNANVSREEFCEWLGFSNKVLYNIESDISLPSIDAVIRIAKRFHTTTDYVLTGKK
jgi:transcriptional regulator with XRE-family HTH domain